MELILPLEKALSLILLVGNLASGFRLLKHENWPTLGPIVAENNLQYERDHVKGHCVFLTKYIYF